MTQDGTSERPAIRPTSVTIGAPDAVALARFYARLLGTEVAAQEDGWAQVRSERLTLNVENEAQWQRPVWPAEPGRPFATVHLDLHVDDLDAAAAWATECGAQPAAHQPQDDVRVMIDPAGHPFCLFL
jgi:catechol 2,3-dioxygenase-like lactoylglutathione lyase family enzyme